MILIYCGNALHESKTTQLMVTTAITFSMLRSGASYREMGK